MKRPVSLFAFALLSFVAQGEDRTRDVQTELKAQGFYYGEIDGKATEEMSAAVRRFQIRNGLKVTGRPDDETLAALGLGAKSPVPAAPSEVPEKTSDPAPSAPKKVPQINPNPPKPDTANGDEPEQTENPPVRTKPRDLLAREHQRDDQPYAQPPDRIFRNTPLDPAVVEPPRAIPNATYDATSALFRGTPYATAPRELQVETIAAAQRILQRERLYRGDVDGAAGPMTAEALFNFQEKHALRPTGRLDIATLAVMRLLPRVVPAPGAPPFYNPNQRRDRTVFRGVWMR